MLESMTPEQFDERYVHYTIEPWGDDWEQAGAIASEVHNSIMAIAVLFGLVDGSDAVWRTPKDYFPRFGKRKNAAEITVGRRRLSAAESEAVARERYGAK